MAIAMGFLLKKRFLSDWYYNYGNAVEYGKNTLYVGPRFEKRLICFGSISELLTKGSA